MSKKITEQVLMLLASEFSLFLAAYAEVNDDRLGDLLADTIKEQTTNALTEAIPGIAKLLIEEIKEK